MLLSILCEAILALSSHLFLQCFIATELLLLQIFLFLFSSFTIVHTLQWPNKNNEIFLHPLPASTSIAEIEYLVSYCSAEKKNKSGKTRSYA